MIIIAGLGNPGPKYQGNRHNIGFMAADEIARRWSFGPERAKFQSVIREGEVATAGGPVKILLMKPQTFYNESGRAMAKACAFYKSAADAVTVLHDEIDLAPGRVRVKRGGGPWWNIMLGVPTSPWMMPVASLAGILPRSHSSVSAKPAKVRASYPAYFSG